MTEQLTQVSKSFAISPPLDCLFSDYWILRALLALNISPLSKRFFSVSGLSSSPNRLLRSNIFNFGEMHLKVFIVYIVLLVSYVRNLCLLPSRKDFSYVFFWMFFSFRCCISVYGWFLVDCYIQSEVWIHILFFVFFPSFLHCIIFVPLPKNQWIVPFCFSAVFQHSENKRRTDKRPNSLENKHDFK